MTNLLVDTCVWLDVAKNHEQHSLLNVIEELCEAGTLTLIVPTVVIAEFQKHKQRLIKESGQSVVSNLKRAQEVILKHGRKGQAKSLTRLLSNVDFQTPIVVAASQDAVKRIEKLFGRGLIVEATDKIKLAAAQRGIDSKAPFHKTKNSMNDAIIIETYISQMANSKGQRFMFVTHNKNDFSDKNEKLPHPDLGRFFSKIKSQYHIKLSEAMRRIDPSFVTESMLRSEVAYELRSLDEILKYENVFYEKRWYDRHKAISMRIAEGKIEGHSKDELNPIGDAFAKRIEKKHGIDNLGPWSDFDWGMLAGKHSALRWVLGDEWDMLDT